MKIKAISKCSLPTLGLRFEAGEVKDVAPEIAKQLTGTNFVRVDEGATGDSEGSYKHREMRSRRRNLSA
jgi:hypothetical protein